MKAQTLFAKSLIKTSSLGRRPTLQAKCACGQHTIAGGVCLSCLRKESRASKGTPHPDAELAAAPAIVNEALSSAGQPLDRETLDFMEPRFGHDFSRVRVHTGAKAAESANAVNARAYTVGSDIVFGAGEYAPAETTGRTLLAHELTHVLQQEGGGGGGPLARLQTEPADSPLEVEADRVARSVMQGDPLAVARSAPRVVQRDGKADDDDDQPAPASAELSITLSGMEFTPSASAVFHAGRTQPQLMAIALRVLVGARYKPGREQEVIDAILARESNTTEFSGTWANDSVAEEGQKIESFTVSGFAALDLVEVLKEKFGGLDLNADQLEVLRLGAATTDLWRRIQPKVPSWYTESMFLNEVSEHRTLLREFEKAKEGAKDSVADRILASFIDAVNVMEAIRKDTRLATDPRAVSGYVIIWNVPPTAAGQAVQEPATVSDERKAAIFLRFIRTEKATEKALTDTQVRAHLLESFASFVGELVLKTVPGDQKLTDETSKPVLNAFPATMTSIPELEPPLYQTSQETDIQFKMSMEFPTVFDAFGSFAYIWQRIEVPTKKLEEVSSQSEGTQSREDVLKVEAKTLKRVGKSLQNADPKKGKPERITEGQALRQRYARANRYTAEDMRSLVRDIGVNPGLAPFSLVTANALLRYIGTGIQFALEIFTRDNLPGESVKHVTFPKVGVYLIRCAGVRVPGKDASIVRAPSVAYLPVYARDPELIAATDAALNAEDQDATPDRINEIDALLDPNIPLPAKRRQQLTEERESLLASQESAGKVLELQRDRLETQIKAVEAGNEKGDLKQLNDQLDEVKERLKTRKDREGKLEGAKPLIATFISDKGQKIPLSLEVEDKGIVDKKYTVYVSDLTTHKSGASEGTGDSKKAAIRDALTRILESDQGYGRGYVAFSIGEEIETVRITASAGALLNEAIENLTLVATVAAIAAAPFTDGASLALLLPIGLVGAIPSGYRLVERASTGTFRLDLEAAMDIVNIAGSVIGAGRLAVAGKIAKVANPSLRAVWVGRGLMILGFGTHGLGVVLLTVGIVKQIQDVTDNPNLSDAERRAALLSILGNVMIQVGIAIGERLVSESHRLPKDTAEEGQAKSRPGAPDQPKQVGGDSTPTMTPEERDARVRDVASKESLFDRLTDEGVRREPRGGGAQRKTAITRGNPHIDIVDVHEAYRLYDEAVAANGSKIEVAIYRDTKTGRYAVAVGDAVSVDPPSGANWEGVLHFHPNPQNAKRFRLPAPADFGGLKERFKTAKPGETVREFLEYDLPGIGRGRTEFGMTAGEDKPFYVTIYLPDGSTTTTRFAHDGSYASFWGGEKTYVEPGSELHKALLAEIKDYLKTIDETTPNKSQAPTTTDEGPSKTAPEPETGPSAERKTVAGGGPKGTKPPPAPFKPLMKPDGTLTPEGLAFLRKLTADRYDKATKTYYRNMSDLELTQRFHNQGDLLEPLLREEFRLQELSLGENPNRLLLDKPNQNFKSVAKELEKAKVSVDRSVLTVDVEEFIAQADLTDLVDALDNHPDKATRDAWREFSFGQKRGDKRKSAFRLGKVGDLRPDFVHVNTDTRKMIVTDSTHAFGSPIHNFKTLFYALVLEKMTGYDVGARDYRSQLKQTVVKIQSGGTTTP